MGMAGTARGIVVHHLLQRGEPPIVHVGRGKADVAQRGNLERPAVRRLAGEAPPARVHRNRLEAVVGEAVSGEEGRCVAPVASQALPAEQGGPGFHFGGHRFSTLPAVPRRVPADQAPLEGGQRAGHHEGIECPAIGGLRLDGIVFGQLLADGHDVVRHLAGFLERDEHLHFKGRHPALGHEVGLVDRVGQGGRVALPHHAEGAGRDRLGRGESALRNVAGGAAHGAIDRQPRVEEERTSQGPPHIGEPIVLRELRQGPAVRHLQNVHVGRRDGIGNGRILVAPHPEQDHRGEAEANGLGQRETRSHGTKMEHPPRRAGCPGHGVPWKVTE